MILTDGFTKHGPPPNATPVKGSSGLPAGQCPTLVTSDHLYIPIQSIHGWLDLSTANESNGAPSKPAGAWHRPQVSARKHLPRLLPTAPAACHRWWEEETCPRFHGYGWVWGKHDPVPAPHRGFPCIGATPKGCPSQSRCGDAPLKGTTWHNHSDATGKLSKCIWNPNNRLKDSCVVPPWQTCF